MLNQKNYMVKKCLIILLVITALAGILRFYRLGEIPTGLHRDEAFLGYNAYSILRTGRDMSGNFLPLHLQSFIYSPAGYSYLSIPFIKLFDLSIFSVRFASAIFGTLTVPLAFMLAEMLIKNRKISLFTSFFVAISPWHINLSRTATENTIVVFFIALGVYLYLLWRQKTDVWKLLSSFLCFGITLAIYQAPRAMLPIFIPFMVFLLGFPKKQILKVAILYLLVIILPLIVILMSPQLSLRIKTVSIFEEKGTQLILDEQIREDGVSGIINPVTRAFHNKFAAYTALFVKNYFAHYSYDFLFTDKGLPDRYRISNSGILFLFELPLLLIGIHNLWQKKRDVAIFIFVWITVVPIGSALTSDDVPNLQRTLIVFPALSMIVATGAATLWDFFFLKRFINTMVTFAKILLLFVAVYNVLFYLHQYYVHESIHRPWFRNEGYETMISEVNRLLPNYEKAVVTTRESAPTIFFLFFSKYDPGTFQKEAYSPVVHDLDRTDFSKYEFSQEECPLRLAAKTDPKTGIVTKQFTGIPGVLYVNYGTCETPESLATELMRVSRGDFSTVFKIVTANNK